MLNKYYYGIKNKIVGNRFLQFINIFKRLKHSHKSQGKVTMTLNEILVRCQKLQIHEERSKNDEYYELVIYNNEIDEWQKILHDMLGEPRKPKGVAPSKSDLKLTKASGGIRINQTLYEREFGDVIIVAKFWPWEDDVHTTLKMALLNTP